ncbi:MAG: NADP-specific glutamate dehydrogenase [Candidatus Delongbacteria bacterium]|jgi:glutamate dehydrogenase (NADP+)|nr:NADP-specific glutamate dehydrogenase [Candidatus Delongbacteria bacterium]
MAKLLKKYMDLLNSKDPNQPEFIQAAAEVIESIIPVLEKHPEYVDAKIVERMIEPERAFQFRVPWMDDNGKVQVNRAFRVEYNSAIGPYKGGLRFHPSVNLSILKFLGFEQVFKNSLTTLPMGGGKGGCDFDPKGKSDNEVMHFCQSFMSELFRHIGPNTDVPAGDIGVGGREIGYMFGQYKKLRNEFTGVLTGKGRNWGGSLIRPEATGYGEVYFAQNMLAEKKDSLKGKICVVSGSGNVSQYCIEKANDFGAICISVSDSSGTIIDMSGIKGKKWDFLMELKNVKRGRVSEFAKKFKTCTYYPGKSVWDVVRDEKIKLDVAFPSATQNEIDESHAKAMLKQGLTVLSEGANMPSLPGAQELYIKAEIMYGPAKAANAGGVAVSGLEMSQNSLRMNWTREEVDGHLQRIMKDIHDNSKEAALKYLPKKEGFINYMAGSNIAGFIKVADSMMDQGCV